MATMPTRIDKDLFDAAKAAGEISSRSAAQQLDHWARIGREVESSTSVTTDEITRVLAGQATYDLLPDQAQAQVRASWDQQISQRLAALDLEDRLRSSGERWAEADDAGDVVVHEPAQPRA
jgi:type IV secretory pathway TrbF-like protein